MKSITSLSFLFLACTCSLLGAVKLPATRCMAGPLDSTVSSFGDEFFNFPPIFGGRAEPGRTNLTGWVEICFERPDGDEVEFTLVFDGVGTTDGIAFPGGQTYTLARNRALNNDLLESRGTLNLKTGEAEIEVHAIFLNTVIADVDRNNRIPFGFPNDYPPTQLPVDLPFDDEPEVFGDVLFVTDTQGNITGFDFQGMTYAPVTVFPSLGLFPPFAFGEEGTFYFVNPTGCLPGAPPQNCPTNQTNPDGILLPKEAFFHPHFELITSDLREVASSSPAPACRPQPAASSQLVEAGGRLYDIGGIDGSGPTGRVWAYAPQTNSWGVAASIPTPVIEAQSATVGSRIYVIGGLIVTGAQGASRAGRPGDKRPELTVARSTAATDEITDQVQVLDTATNRWTTAKAMPTPTFDGVAAAVGAKIYIIGGVREDSSSNRRLHTAVQIYDTETNQWSFGSAAPLATAGSSGVAAGSDIYLIGGRTGNDTPTNRVFVYKTRFNAWVEGPPLPRPVVDAAAAQTDGRIFVAGGRLSVAGPNDPFNMQIFEVEPSLWREGHAPPISTATNGAAALNGKFFLSGGRLQSFPDEFPGTPTGAFQFYDPASGWVPCASYPLFTAGNILNEASGRAGTVYLSPGSRAVILGENLASSTVSAPPIRFAEGVYTSDIPTSLGGVSIEVDGKPAPIISVSPERVEFQVPYSVVASARNYRYVPLRFTREGLDPAPPAMVPIFAASPGIYVHNYGELREPAFLFRSSAVARNADGFLNDPSQPARPGEIISLRMTGLGLVLPTPENGQRSSQEAQADVIFTLKVTIAGREAEVVSISLARGEVGVYEVSAIIPLGTPLANNVPVQVTILGVGSNLASIVVR